VSAAIALLVLSVFLPQRGSAEVGVGRGRPSAGRTATLGLRRGWIAFNQSYFVLGVGAGYYILEAWTG